MSNKHLEAEIEEVAEAIWNEEERWKASMDAGYRKRGWNENQLMKVQCRLKAVEALSTLIAMRSPFPIIPSELIRSILEEEGVASSDALAIKIAQKTEALLALYSTGN